jgi:hypothetical protein
MTTFNPLNVPDQWEQYYTKYPQGYTLIEALLNWVQQTNDMTTNVNDWNTYLDSFVATFDTDLQDKVRTRLDEMNADGSLTALINQSVLNEQVKGNDNTHYRMVAGTIRNDGTGWTIVQDGSHIPVNLTSVVIDPDNHMQLLLNHSPTCTKIGSMVVTPDETLLKGGLLCGGSVGATKTYLQIAAPLLAQVTGKTVLTTDKWHKTSVTVAASADGTGYVLTHPAQQTAQPPTVSLADDGGNNKMGGELAVSFTLTTTTVTYYQYLHGYAKYNGTSWDLLTDNVDAATLSWDSTNTALKISHPTIEEEYALSISGNGIYRPVVTSQAVGSMLVQFLNSAGTVVTTPDTNMKVNFARFDKVKSNFPSGLKTNVHRGYIQCDPVDIVEPYGNFWIMGMHGE